MTKYSIKQQINCVERELKYRQWVYPNRVLSGKMTVAAKDMEIELMQNILETLRMVERTHLDKPWNQNFQQKDETK